MGPVAKKRKLSNTRARKSAGTTVRKRQLLWDVDPDAAAHLHDLFPTVKSLSKAELEEAAERGFEVRSGKMSTEEVERLKYNFRKCRKKLTEKYGEERASDLILEFLGMFKQQNKSNRSRNSDAEVCDLDNKEYHKARGKFFQKLGKNLRSRTLHSLYLKTRDSLTDLKVMRDLSEEDKAIIIKHAQDCKRLNVSVNYSALAQELKCTPKAAHLYARTLLTDQGDVKTSGRWTKAEEVLLIKTMQEVMRVDEINELLDVKKIPWTEIANKANMNRTASQVAKYFTGVLRWRLSKEMLIEAAMNDKTKRKITARIIYFMAKENYDKEAAVDWNLLVEKFKHKHNMRMLVHLWDELKSGVPHVDNKQHGEIVRYLEKHTLPQLVNMKSAKKVAKLDRFYSS